ncbi:MAG: carboxypeptidase regulatory-like domain-containing protein [Micrococcales bacterium]|nr:carboxypeptidase regulatory-like domain-containing protein [Micrococcales bacterium]
MGRHRRIVGIIVVAGVALGGGLAAGRGPDAARADENIGQMIGSVVDLDDDPVSGVLVEAWEVSQEVWFATEDEECVGGMLPEDFNFGSVGVPDFSFVTDQSGEFDGHIWGGDGRWIVRASAAGLAPAYFPSPETGLVVGCFELGDIGPVVDVGEVTIEPEGSISGAVVDTSDVGVAGLEVAAVPLDEDGIEPGWSELLTHTTVTEIDGSFTMSGLSSGQWVLGWENDPVYLDSEDSDGGTVVELEAGEHQVLDDDLVAWRGASVSGSVVMVSGAAVSDVSGSLEVWDPEELEWVGAGVFETDNHGSWDVDSLLPGTYRASVEADEDGLLGGWSVGVGGAVAWVTLLEGGTGVFPEVLMPQGARIVGQVTPVGASEGTEVVVFVEVTDADSDSQWEPIASGVVDALGVFEVPGVPVGPVLVYAEGGNGLAGRYAVGGAAWEEQATPVNVTPAGAVLNVGVISLTSAATLQGVVEDISGAPVPGALVFVTSSIGLGGDEAVIDGGQTNELGEYEIEGIVPGSYELSAISLAGSEDSEESQIEAAVVASPAPSVVMVPPLVVEPDPPAPAFTSLSTPAAASGGCDAAFNIGSYNVGEVNYSGYKDDANATGATKWQRRLKGKGTGMRAKIRGSKADIVTIQEADVFSKPKELQTVGQPAVLFDQQTSIVGALTTAKTKWKLAVPTSDVEKRVADKAGADVKQSLKNNILVKGKTYEVKGGGMYSGYQLVGAINRADYKDSLVPRGTIAPKKDDKVVPWTLLKRKGRAHTGCQAFVVASFHAHTAGHFFSPAKARKEYFNSLILLSLAKKMNKVREKQIPLVIGGDFNSYYKTVEAVFDLGWILTDSAVRTLHESGWSDARLVVTGFAQRAQCTGKCKTHATNVKKTAVLDYIFTRHGGGDRAPTAFKRIKGPGRASDHFMITSTVKFKKS